MEHESTAQQARERCVQLVMRLLDPEDFGHAVTEEVRDAARKALGGVVAANRAQAQQHQA